MLQEFPQSGDPVADFIFNVLPLLGVLAMGALGLYLLVLGYRSYLASAYLQRSGRLGHARVTQKWVKEGYVSQEERRHSPPIKSYFLRFELLNDPRAFAVKQVAPAELWTQVEPGDTVDVLYHPQRRLMRLAAWKTCSGKAAGTIQMSIGAVMASATAGIILERVLTN